jgi:chromosome segregation ATPase
VKQSNPNHLYNKYNDQITDLQEKRKELIQRIELEYMRKQKIEDVYKKEMEKLDDSRKKIAAIESQNFFSLRNTLKREKHENEELRFRLNDSNADIRRKRTKINEMRKQRTLLDGVYSKIESKLRRKGNQLLSMIEKTENLKKDKMEKVAALAEIEQKAKEQEEVIKERKF